MVEMKSGEVVLSLAAQLASWRAVLVLVRTWATCKPWQRKDFHQYYSTFLADCLNQSQQTVWVSAGGAAATESRKVGKGRRERRYTDVDGPGANPDPELGPHGPTLKKQVRKGFDWRDARRPADSVDNTQDFERDRETRAQDEDSSAKESSSGKSYIWVVCDSLDLSLQPSSFRKKADASSSSSSSPSAAPVRGWRRFFCLGKGK